MEAVHALLEAYVKKEKVTEVDRSIRQVAADSSAGLSAQNTVMTNLSGDTVRLGADGEDEC